MTTRPPTKPTGSDQDTWAPDGGAVEPEPTGPRYRDAVEVGRGSMGRVLGVTDAHLGRRVAYKELRKRSLSASGRARFLREARITAQLQHPGIAPVYDLGEDEDGTPWYTMRFVEGQTLKDALAAASRPPERLALLPRFVDACQAVAYAHARGVVHRDLKPENLLLGAFGETLVVDWGLAKRAGEEELADGTSTAGSSDDTGGTLAGTVLGTPNWMSPEQARGEVLSLDARSDVWSLGVILFELLTGARPFQGATTEETLQRVRIAPVPNALELAPGAPTELAAICERALQRDPDRRYPSAAELAADVEAFLSGGWVRAYAYSPWERVVRQLVAHRLLVGTIGAACLVLLVVAALSYTQVRDERDRAQAAEVTGRRHLAEAFAGKAQGALVAGDLLQAELFAAAALALDERPDARGVLARTRAAWRPSVGPAFGPPEGCRGVAAWPSGDRAICAGPEEVSGWDLSTGAVIWRAAGGAASAAVSPDGSRVAAQDEGRVRLLDARDGMELRSLVAPRRGANPSPVWRADGARLAYARAGEVVVVDGAGEELGAVRVSGTVVGLAWRGDDVYVASLSGHVVRIEGYARVAVATPPLAGNGLYAIATSALHVAVGTGSDGVLLLDPETLAVAGAIPGHDGPVMALAFASDGRWLVSGGEDRLVRVVDVAGSDAAPALHLPGSGNPSLDFFAPDRLLVGSGGARPRVWVLPEQRPASRLGAGDSGLTAVAWHPDGQRLAASTGSGRVDQFDRSGRVGSIQVADTVVRDLIYGDPDTLITSTSQGRVEAWDAAGRSVGVFLEGPVQLNLAMDRVRGQLYGTGADGQVTRWERWGAPTERFRGDPSQSLWEVVVAADGSALAWTDGEDELTVVGLPDRSPWLQRRFPTSPRSIALAPRGDRLAMSTPDESIEVVALPDGRLLHRLIGPTNVIDDLEFSPDGAWLVASSWDQRAWVFDARDGRLAAVLADHTHRVVDAEFSADGRFLATASWDGTARVWDLAAIEGDTAPVLAELEARHGLRLEGARMVAVPP